MDKSVLGSGSKGLIQTIFNDFNFNASANFIDNIQSIVTEYMKLSSFSVGISDLISDATTNQKISNILTVNGVRFSLEDGSWGLIRASSNKPSLVVVTESPTSDKRKKMIFNFIDNLLQKTGKIGEYDQKI